MLASLECFVPILSATLFTNVYNATIELKYPWNATFYFGAIGFTLIGNQFDKRNTKHIYNNVYVAFSYCFKSFI